MKQANTFQTVLLVVFGLFIIIAVITFSLRGGKGGGVEFLGNVVVWGTLSEQLVTQKIGEIYSEEESVKITYKQKQENTFDRDLVEALASGIGPDIILLPQDLILRHDDKIYPIPFESMSLRTFKDRFIEEGELYINDEGILALPFMVDPMVMFWNRDSYSSSGISRAPSFWDEFYTLAPVMTSRGSGSNINRSAISFGEFRNVTHAKEIISLLIMQAGNSIVAENTTRKDGYSSTLSHRFDYAISPADSALRLYTEFSNPAKTSYSWNRSLPESRDMFTAGDLATYFGFASEFSEIKRKNPHLNFDIAEVPQARGMAKKVTFGKMQGLAILKATKSVPAAFQAAVMLSDSKFVSELSNALELPPVRRDLLSQKPTDANLSLLYDSALISNAWYDPSPDSTEDIFMGMVERVVSGRNKVSDSVFIAERELEKLLK